MVITQTPLRISFAGGGTDLPDYYESRGGYVVSTAIDKCVFVIVTGRYDKKIYINYSKKEIVDHIDEIQHELVREAMKLTGITSGIEITMLSEIPSEGSGLGSSSSFTVGLLNAFHLYQHEQVGPMQLAEEACEIEMHRCHKPIGKQDQYIAAYGGLSAFQFKREGKVEVERIRLPSDQLSNFIANCFLFFTGQTRKSEGILSEQKQRTEENLEYLDRIKELAFDTHDAIQLGDFDRVGKNLNDNWHLKKKLTTKISNDRIDEMYSLAIEAGATGAKICGAGGGGFLLVYCPESAHKRLRTLMGGYRQMPITFEPNGSRAIFNYQRASWK